MIGFDCSGSSLMTNNQQCVHDTNNKLVMRKAEQIPKNQQKERLILNKILYKAKPNAHLGFGSSLTSNEPVRVIQSMPKRDNMGGFFRKASQMFNQKALSPYGEGLRVFSHKYRDISAQSSHLKTAKNSLKMQKQGQNVQAIQDNNDRDLQGLLRVKIEAKQQSTRKHKKMSIFITKGNNHAVIRQIFVGRFKMSQAVNKQSAHLSWLQSIAQKAGGFRSQSSYQDRLPQIGKKQIGPLIYNYLQGESQLTNKQRLYKNFKKFRPQAIGEYVPLSFIIDFKQEPEKVQEVLVQFLERMLRSHKGKMRSLTVRNYYADIHISAKTMQRIADKHSSHDKSNKDSQQDQEQIWILKPSSLNRGRGISLFSSLKQLSKLLSESPLQISMKLYSSKLKPNCYIIQEYIANPLLIDGHKFDLRFWVFVRVAKVNGKKMLKIYLFKHGYARLASVKYQEEQKQDQGQQQQQKNQVQSPNKSQKSSQKLQKNLSVDKADVAKQKSPQKTQKKKSNINNLFVHLTNHAVQKDSPEYGQYCQGNQLSITQIVEYFTKINANCTLTEPSLLLNIQKIVQESIGLAKEKLLGNNLNKNFQLLGYDFLIDSQYKLWLLEINNNPCLDDSSQLKATIQRQMLAGLVCLSQLCEPPKQENSESWIQL